MAGADDLGGVDAGVDAEVLAPGPQGHDHLLEAGVTRPFTDAVDGDLHLPSAGPDPRKAVGRGEAEIVVAVDRPDDSIGPRGLLTKLADELEELFRGGVAHGVGDVEGRRARLNGVAEHLDEEGWVRPAGVLGTELYVVAVGLGVGHHLADPIDDRRSGHPELVLEVEIRGGDEGVDPRFGCRLYGLPGGIDVTRVGACKAGDGRPVGGPDLAGDPPHGFEVVRAGRRESGLDDIDPEAGELTGDLQLLRAGEAGAGRLLAVAQGGVEDQDSIGGLRCHSVVPPSDDQ